MVGAVINETLRLFTVLPFFSKKTVPDGLSQAFNVAGRTRKLPSGILILINISALHRNPKVWASTGRETSSADTGNPAAAFDPDLWFRTDSGAGEPRQGTGRLRRSQDGPFVHFSDESRGCLGKEFALVEHCGVVTRVVSEYSVELTLDGVGEEQDGDIRGTRRWKEARERAELQLSAHVEFKMSLRFAGRLLLSSVRGGKESFVGL